MTAGAETLEFLSPDAARPRDGRAPTARSAIEWIHRAAGARLETESGWRVVRSYGEPGREAAACAEAVGVADLAQLGKLELQAPAPVGSKIVAELTGGDALEPGRAILSEHTWWCPVAPGRVLAVTPPARTAAVRERLAEAAAAASSPAVVCELTAGLGSNAIAGPLAREALARLTALDLRDSAFPLGGFAPGSVARVPGMVLREGEDRFLHLFGAGHAGYVWTATVDAAEHLGGAAVGADALPAPLGTGEVAARA